MSAWPIPKTPVFGWAAMQGHGTPALPCVLSLPQLHFTTSGRASILLALEHLNVGQGDRVLLPTYHCPTMVAPVVLRGAQPVFYPIDEHGAPQLAWIQAQDLQGVRAMLAAHLFGLPQPMAVLRTWCDDQGIALIEDCAHALFGSSDGRPVGAWGDVAIASLTKFLPLPDGGCMVTNRDPYTPSLRPAGALGDLRSALDVLETGAVHGRLPGANWLVQGAMGLARTLRRPATDKVGTAAPGSEDAPSGNPTSCVDVQRAQMSLAPTSRWLARHLPRARIVQARRQRYAELARRLSGVPGMHPLMPNLPSDSAPYVFPLWVQAPDPGYAELRRLGMPVFRWDWHWPGVPDITGDHGLNWAHHVLQLACHQDMTDTEIDVFVTTLLRLYATLPRAAALPLSESPCA
jgi:perosamine synthetase